MSRAAAVKSDVREVGSQLFRPRHLAPVVNTESDVVSPQQIVNLRNAPALVTNLDRISVTRRQHAQEVSQPLQVELPVWRKLEKDRAQSRIQRFCTREEQ